LYCLSAKIKKKDILCLSLLPISKPAWVSGMRAPCLTTGWADSSEAGLLWNFSYFKQATTAYLPILIYLSGINTFPSHSLILVSLHEVALLNEVGLQPHKIPVLVSSVKTLPPLHWLFIIKCENDSKFKVRKNGSSCGLF
jgi:hypothetical protein